MFLFEKVSVSFYPVRFEDRITAGLARGVVKEQAFEFRESATDIIADFYSGEGLVCMVSDGLWHWLILHHDC